MAKPMPAIFFGHGNPINALEHNAWTAGWAALGAKIPRPKAVLRIRSLVSFRYTSDLNARAAYDS